MHVPNSSTKEITVLSFREALEMSDAAKDYDVSRWLYVPPFYTEYRYILGTRGRKPLICVGINPSTAKPDALDNTLKSVERIALGNGYDSFIMFNVYAQRATDPDDMESDENEYLHRQNMAAFEYALSLGKSPTVWAAWGTIVEKRGYLKKCMTEMVALGKKYGAHWVKSGVCSKAGHPHHPLYLKKDSPLEDFDMGKYISTLE
ncbi:MAG: DUF1643 domain-containing protein [Clostridia bacterium]|nr:DUF1643 domain-containing protein [Clostridia bacterium]